MNFPNLINDQIIKAARGLKVERLPIWVMRQAGRHLPEFQELRKKHNFFEICYTPELASMATLQPIERYDLDAAIIFSDILVIPQAMGMEIEMKPGIGPSFTSPLESPSDLSRLFTPTKDSNLSKVYEAITLTRHKLQGKVPLIGFAGGPWTLMGYMIEGGGSKTMSKAKRWLYCWPEQSHHLLEMLTSVIIDYLVEQVAAGAQMLQLFEVSAGCLTPQHFSTFVLPYLHTIVFEVKAKLIQKRLEVVPIVGFAKDVHYGVEYLAEVGFDVISLDWTINPSTARAAVGSEVTLQGNLDPCALYAPPEKFKKMVKSMVQSFGTHRYIVNLGHGVYPDTSPDQMKLFIDTVHEVSQQLIS